MAEQSTQKKISWKIYALLGTITMTVILHIATGLFDPIFTSIYYFIYPPKLELSITSCMIYRTDPHHFPICEINYVAYNPTERDVTAKLKYISFFHNNILYNFPGDKEIAKVQAKDKLPEHVKFQDPVLDLALKVPQDSSTAMVKLIWEYTGKNKRDSLVLTDSDVVKCSYWQSARFNSEKEALALGLYHMPASLVVQYSTKAGEKGRYVQNINYFTDRSGLLDFNPSLYSAESIESLKKTVGWYFYKYAFLRRYGGTYLGLLASDTTEEEFFPHDIFDTTDYDKYLLLGMNLDQDFSEIKEFIYYNFDQTRDDPIFRICQENSEFYVLVTYEDSLGIAQLLQSLALFGYRPDSEHTIDYEEPWETLLRITPDNKLDSLVNLLNNRIDGINQVIGSDGFLLFFPFDIKDELGNRIIGDMQRLTKKTNFYALSFDCTPYKSKWKASLFSKPIFLYLNFSDETKSKKISNLRLGWEKTE